VPTPISLIFLGVALGLYTAIGNQMVKFHKNAIIEIETVKIILLIVLIEQLSLKLRLPQYLH
jgi:hypothetical protein